MEQKSADKFFPTVGDGSGLAQTDGLYKEELQLALRNRGMPLEALRYLITPTGLHYLLIHYDIPAVSAPPWRAKNAGFGAQTPYLNLRKNQKPAPPTDSPCHGSCRQG